MENTPTEPVKATKTSTTEPGLTALQLKMKDKLSGARFRWLNEKLYTTEGNEAYTLFQEKPELFDEVSLHTGGGRKRLTFFSFFLFL